MVKRQERPEDGDIGESKPRSKRRVEKPAKGYKPSTDRDNFGVRKAPRRPDTDDGDLYLDLGDDDFEDDDEDLEDFDADFDDEDFEDDDFPNLDDDDDLA